MIKQQRKYFVKETLCISKVYNKSQRNGKARQARCDSKISINSVYQKRGFIRSSIKLIINISFAEMLFFAEYYLFAKVPEFVFNRAREAFDETF